MREHRRLRRIGPRARQNGGGRRTEAALGPLVQQVAASFSDATSALPYDDHGDRRRRGPAGAHGVVAAGRGRHADAGRPRRRRRRRPPGALPGRRGTGAGRRRLGRGYVLWTTHHWHEPRRARSASHGDPWGAHGMVEGGSAVPERALLERHYPAGLVPRGVHLHWHPDKDAAAPTEPVDPKAAAEALCAALAAQLRPAGPWVVSYDHPDGSGAVQVSAAGPAVSLRRAAADAAPLAVVLARLTGVLADAVWPADRPGTSPTRTPAREGRSRRWSAKATSARFWPGRAQRRSGGWTGRWSTSRRPTSPCRRATPTRRLRAARCLPPPSAAPPAAPTSRMPPTRSCPP